MSDTRRWPRLPLAIEVKVRLEQLDHAIDAKTLNISREGVFIAMDPPKPIGTRVRVSLSIASTSEKFMIEGVVVRCTPDADGHLAPGETPGIAVFLTLTSPGYTRICDELATRAPEPVFSEAFDEEKTSKNTGPAIEAVRKPR